ncbi:hypothetical protein GCM10022254_39180 [Actinomadura meridiana]|uniref:Peptidase inhibitor family I36 n=1 Tax=Actinomadura meridiana TaxID=559626 RepID=A0ABP8C660_9ACTN
MRIGRLAVCATASLVAGATVFSAAPAQAAWESCPSGYGCFYRLHWGNNGQGHFQFSGDNSNWNSYGVTGEDASAYDHGTSSLYLNIYDYNGHADYCMTRTHKLDWVGNRGGSNFWSSSPNTTCNVDGT